jgi:hypothetical protein
MSAYEGLESFECHFTLPHTTKIARKPKGIGCELKSMADASSGIILKLELMEGKDRNRAKKYENVFKSHTAITLRLVEDYFGTARTVIADSAFSSVDTCSALLDHGLYFLGIVKTASSRFPKAYFKAWASNESLPRGSHKVVKSFVRISNGTEAQIFAVGWMDKKLKTLICSRGITTPGVPARKRRHRIIIENGRPNTIRYEIQVNRPKVVEQLFNSFSTLDIHDHFRQGSLAMEQGWQTRTWWHRLFSSIFGIICTDAYLAYKLEWSRFNRNDESELMSFRCFLGRLAYSIINYDQPDQRILRSRADYQELRENAEMVRCFISGRFG